MSNLEGQYFHLIGIGGAGMSVVAQLLAAEGARVSGSDAQESTVLENLRAQGIHAYAGHAQEHVPQSATVVISTAIKADNEELIAAREGGLPILHRSQALALAAKGKDFVAVAGAHGKTTTSGMLAAALTATGADPSFAIGGVVSGLRTGAHLGQGSAFVAEADESDKSFLNYASRIEIVTNVEPDHLDTYGSAQAFEEAFVEFARRLVPGGLLITCADDPGAWRLAQRAVGEGLRVATYGVTPVDQLPGGAVLGESHTVLRILERTAQGSRFELQRHFADGTVEGAVQADLQVPGDHVVLNAGSVWLAGIELGTEAEPMAAAIAAFGGTGRRFEDRGEEGGVRVVDDYAHHPTEIEALLTTARGIATERGGRLLVLFQPHLFSRTREFAQRFGQALSLADAVVVTDVYPAREVSADFPGISGNTVVEQMTAGKGQFVEQRLDAAHRICELSQPRDLVLTVGAGDVTELAGVIVDCLHTYPELRR